ncbi:MAG: hypothetical protein OJF52_002284 [Nitrospira sp.]|nr:MAG: hypothetical protein OJF52_002284 [Nitrospira sp.]
MYRVNRRGLCDFLNRLIGRYPYRCRDSGRRFYKARRC